MNLRTKRGYDFYEAASTLQKAIRRNDVKVAGFFALELWESGYRNYVWKRLFTISAEDLGGMITKEVDALYRGHELVNKNAKGPKGRIFVSKAVMLMCQWPKNRDADHLQNFVYDKYMGLSEEDIEKQLDEDRKDPLIVPEYAFDVHTKRGKMMGKTKADFIKDEYECLDPKQPGLFDEMVNWGWPKPHKLK